MTSEYSNTVVVMWSGGADSTLVLYKELMGNAIGNVWALSLECSTFGSPGQQEMERLAMELFKEEMKSRHIEFEHRFMKFESCWGQNDDSQANMQATIMFPMMAWAVPDNASVKMGYIRKDDVFEFQERLSAIWEAQLKAMGRKASLSTRSSTCISTK